MIKKSDKIRDFYFVEKPQVSSCTFYFNNESRKHQKNDRPMSILPLEKTHEHEIFHLFWKSFFNIPVWISVRFQ